MDHDFELVDAQGEEFETAEVKQMASKNTDDETGKTKSQKNEEPIEDKLAKMFGGNTCDALLLVLSVIKMVKSIKTEFEEQPLTAFLIYVLPYVIFLRISGFCEMFKLVFLTMGYFSGFVMFIWLTMGVVKREPRSQQIQR